MFLNQPLVMAMVDGRIFRMIQGSRLSMNPSRVSRAKEISWRSKINSLLEDLRYGHLSCFVTVLITYMYRYIVALVFSDLKSLLGRDISSGEVRECDGVKYSKIPILRPPLGLSKSGLKDHFWTVSKVVSS